MMIFKERKGVVFNLKLVACFTSICVCLHICIPDTSGFPVSKLRSASLATSPFTHWVIVRVQKSCFD